MSVKVHGFGEGPHGGQLHAFHCPACGYDHAFEVGGDKWPAYGGFIGWTWNESLELPTFIPSLVVNGRCHSIVTAGRIQFLPDCKHDLAGQTVDLPDWSDKGAL